MMRIQTSSRDQPDNRNNEDSNITRYPTQNSNSIALAPPVLRALISLASRHECCASGRAPAERYIQTTRQQRGTDIDTFTYTHHGTCRDNQPTGDRGGGQPPPSSAAVRQATAVSLSAPTQVLTARSARVSRSSRTDLHVSSPSLHSAASPTHGANVYVSSKTTVLWSTSFVSCSSRL